MTTEQSAYELLGVKPGASIAELKIAYRDMAKVWHPDRFAHDVRLRQKAEEKLKEINEAYEQLSSGRTPRPTVNPPEHTYAQRQRVPSRRWAWSLLALVVFGAAFLVTTRSLLKVRAQRPSPSTEAQAVTNETDAPVDPSKPRSREQVNGNRIAVALNPDSTSTEEARAPAPTTVPQPMPTVTVLIDPASGLLARVDCPVKTKMTYPVNTQPHEYCSVVHVKAERDDASERVKSVAKRVVSPGKWLGSESKETGAVKQ